MQHIPELRALLRHVTKAGDFVRWLHEEGDRIVAAAEVLGGARWARRAEAIVASARAGHDLGPRHGDLVALRQLLNLELTHDLESEESVRFAALHPDDPCADHARLCAEALDRGVRALEALRLAGLTGVREAA